MSSLSDNREPVSVLISGRGSNLRALLEHSLDPPPAYRIVQVLADNPTAGGLAVARDFGVAARCVPTVGHADRADFEHALAAAIDMHPPCLLVLAGFMRVLSAAFVERYADRILNIHPSLLPHYPGLHTHRRVLAAQEPRHGATVHFVTAELDGGPPVLQASVAVAPGDDESSLAARVQAREHLIYPVAVRWYCEGRLRCHEGRAWLDGVPLTEPVRYDDPAPSREH